MLIAIISDTHDNIPNLEKFLNWAKDNKIEAIIHCGDLCAPGVLKNILALKFGGKIYLIHGNVSDRELLEKVATEFSNVEFCGDFGEIELGGKKIAFIHYPEEAKKLVQTGKYDMVFYGHDHRPWFEKILINTDKNTDKHRFIGVNPCVAKQDLCKSVFLVNPGTLAGMFNKATFAVYDTEADKLELKILELL